MEVIYKEKLLESNIQLGVGYNISSREIKEMTHREFISPKFENGDYYVEDHGYKMNCKFKGNAIWSFRHGVSFLYTNFFLYPGKIYFGTSGNGGHFYGLELSTGKMIIDINTGGTEHIAYIKNHAYLQCRGDLICVNLDNNLAEETLILKPKMGDYSPIWTDCKILRTIVNDFTKDGCWNDFYLIEISLK